MKLLASTSHLLTVAEYLSLALDTRTELVGGLIYDVPPASAAHRYAVDAVHAALATGLASANIVQSREAVAIAGVRGIHAPEIDVAVLAARTYVDIPTAADASAFVEVSDRTYRDDRGTKIPLYLTAGIPSWIVNLAERRVEAYVPDSDPASGPRRVYGRGEACPILGVEIAVDSLFALEKV